METPVPEGALEQVRAAIFAGRKIDAIKLYRETTGKGLAAAKEAVEAMERELRASAPERFESPPQSTGCFGMMMLLLFGLPGVVLLLGRL